MAAIPESLATALADRYRLERELGAGGMATVYLAEDLKHQRQVAVKVLRPDLAATLGAERFFREIAIAARLSHPHILGLHDSGEAAGFLYYVMPYVEGISLRQKLQQEGELPVPEAVRILRDVADALAHAHRQGVVHRDIKPENVMLVERHALVMDFGVAKAVAAGKEASRASLTSAGTALGTPAYMAPEQAAGDLHVDHRADLYAWGVVAYELLAGQPPFVRATPQNTLAAQVTATPEPVTHHRANVPGTLARLVMQCLEKKPADRPQTAEEVLRQLDQVLTPSGGMTPTDTRPYQTAASRKAKRRSLLIGAAAVSGLVAMSVLGWQWWQGRAEPIVADRVLVAPLEAEGAAFQGLARDLATLPTALTREGIGKPVAAATVRDLVAGSRADPATRAQFLAKRTGAAYVLRTSCEPQGAGANCQLELFEQPGNRLRMAVPVKGTAIDSAFSARVQEQALAMLLLELYWGDETTWLGEHITPSLEAVRAFNLITQGNDNESDSLLFRVWRADSNWILPVSSWLGNAGLTDSGYEALYRRPGLTERDRLLIEVKRGWSYNDPERQFEVFRQLYNGWPSFWLTMYVRFAVATHRPQSALDAIAWADSAHSPTKQGEAHTRLATIALHHLGRYREQLTLARAIREAPAEIYGAGASGRAALWQALEIQGYAGLGDVDAVRRVVAELEPRSGRNWPWLWSEQNEDLGLVAALELMAHGRGAEGEAMLNSLLPAMKRLREEGHDLSLAENEVWALEWTGRLEEAERLAKMLLGELRSWGPELLGSLGNIAARQGRREQALTYSRQLADSAAHYLKVRDMPGDILPSGVRARYLYYRATIAARLGDREEAVRLLKEARTACADWVPGHFPWMHIDPDLASLRGYPPFEELLKPRN